MAGRVSQEVIEAEVVATPNARASQVLVETQVVTSPNARVSQLVKEVQVVADAAARVSQFVVEVLICRVPFMPPPIYPELVGLGFDVQWMPQFFNMPSAVTTTGASIDLGLAEWPLHDFTLVYNFLRDQFIAGTQEFKTMMGFFLRLQGNPGRFLFRNPDDCRTTGEVITASADGTTHLFAPLMRTFGVGENIGIEPIGWLDTTQPINIYFDGALQDPSTYDLIMTDGCNMQVDFKATPTAGVKITGDYSYYYYCKFPSDSNTFNKFMDKVWALQQITIHSCRAGA